jgi:hypothetical protein
MVLKTKGTGARGRRGRTQRIVKCPVDSFLNRTSAPNFQAAARSRLRLEYLARRIYALGPRPFFELLRELESGAPMRKTLERYARLDAAFVRVNGGDQFVAPPLVTIEGGGK